MPQQDLKALALLDILRQHTDAEHRLSAPALAEKLAACGVPAERRSVYRAIAGLIARGEPIEQTTTGYYYNADAAGLLDDGAVFALAAAVQGAWFLSEARRAALLRTLAAQHMPESAARAFRAYAEAVSAAPAADDTIFLALRTVAHAIAAHSQLTFTVPGEPLRIRVNPYAVFLAEGAFWLICNTDGREDLSRFPLGQLGSLRVEAQARRSYTEVTAYRGRFDAADAARRLFSGEEHCP